MIELVEGGDVAKAEEMTRQRPVYQEREQQYRPVHQERERVQPPPTSFIYSNQNMRKPPPLESFTERARKELGHPFTNLMAQSSPRPPSAAPGRILLK
jgi:hypothetical protein